MERAAGVNGNTGGAPLVVVRGEDGFRVYSPANPGRSYLVSGNGETCTCPEFRNGRRGESCPHIVAVANSFGTQHDTGEQDRYASDERRAIQEENRNGGDQGFFENAGTPIQMLVRRSVSPDGRIDSLSIEFSTSVDESLGAAVVDRAARLLSLQSAIAQGFLAGAPNGNGAASKPANDNGANGAALAEMVGIGGMDGKWGRRLFISFQADGRSFRLFGSKTQLAEAIRTAGFPAMAERIEEGVALRVPCRLITKPSPDGKYVNVERVLPVPMPSVSGRNGR